ncbi:MAG: DUF547 domain-containing protein [Pseudomonadales bacterium]|nr:DUF547 domain-containing protein [Pseudomonadales bacterium]
MIIKAIETTRSNRIQLAYLCALLLLVLTTLSAQAAPQSDLLGDWNHSKAQSTATIDHSAWQQFLDRYIDAKHPSGINSFGYSKVSKQDKRALKKYLGDMQALNPLNYNKAEQKAYWINLYNALTVDLILDHYPVESITDLGKGFFAFGPWDDPIATINKHELTLNNIEHGILRPIWQDKRIHYAVNCASYSCPNLAAKAYTASNTEQLLEQGAKDYINHPRGVRFEDGDLLLSSIYDWYLVDFGDSIPSLLKHLQHYAKPELARQLKSFKGKPDFEYDWQLNELN